MNEISTPQRRTSRRGLIFGGFAAAAIAGGLATALIVIPGTGRGHVQTQNLNTQKVSLLAASVVLGKASDAAAAGPDLKPRPGQYLYFTSKSQQVRNGAQAISTSRKAWLSVDGKRPGLLDQTENGNRMYVWLCDSSAKKGPEGDPKVNLGKPPTNCQAQQPAYDPTIPTDANAAKTWLYRHSVGGNPPDVQAFITVGDTIRERYLGSRPLAALFKAAAQIPGVKVYPHVTDLAGRTGIGVGQTYGGVRQELIFDPKTYKLIGEQQVSDDDTSFHPAWKNPKDVGGKQPAVGPNGQVIYSSAVLGFGVVNRPGQLP